MKSKIGKTYVIVKKNGWFWEGDALTILDHRLRRKYFAEFNHAEHEPNIGAEYAPETQETYEYEFAVEINQVVPKRDPHYSTFNDLVLLDFISDYCKEKTNKQ